MRLSIIRFVVTGSRDAVTMIGCANDIAGRVTGSSRAATTLMNSCYLRDSGVPHQWQSIVSQPNVNKHTSAPIDMFKVVHEYCNALAHLTARTVTDGKELLVIGGDHSCGMGTWSGVATAIRPYGNMGLIWVDAHMDSHLPSTSETGNIHGMPVAHLLGYGDTMLAGLLDKKSKVQPENLALVGIRSYEKKERALLEQLNVRVFYDDEVKRRGLNTVMQEAIDIANNGTYGYGISVDLDVFRASDAPAVAVSEGDLNSAEFLAAIPTFDLQRLLALEIVEFLPRLDDENHTTEKLAVSIFSNIFINKFKQLAEDENNTDHISQRVAEKY